MCQFCPVQKQWFPMPPPTSPQQEKSFCFCLQIRFSPDWPMTLMFRLSLAAISAWFPQWLVMWKKSEHTFILCLRESQSFAFCGKFCWRKASFTEIRENGDKGRNQTLQRKWQANMVSEWVLWLIPTQHPGLLCLSFMVGAYVHTLYKSPMTSEACMGTWGVERGTAVQAR